jgi:hypothetical protein
LLLQNLLFASSTVSVGFLMLCWLIVH